VEKKKKCEIKKIKESRSKKKIELTVAVAAVGENSEKANCYAN
jgi:hypothetical protein